jgi:transcriptional regulator with XRE-family HTH domain
MDLVDATKYVLQRPELEVSQVITTYVKKLRLRQEMQFLRDEHKLTQEQLAKRAAISRGDVQQLEAGRVVDPAVVLAILTALQVDADRWARIMRIAGEATEDGWWETARGIGSRQAVYANLEAGAASIKAYEQTFAPGLLQIPDYVQSRAVAQAALEPMVKATVEGMLAGRRSRQSMVRRPGGPTLEVIVDEVAARRLAVPSGVMKTQLRHLADVPRGDQERVVLRVLPVRARIKDYTVPRCSFSIYSYPDKGDPRVVAMDTVTEDVLLTSEEEVAPYDKLWANLWDAALSPDESAELLASAADELPDE